MGVQIIKASISLAAIATSAISLFEISWVGFSRPHAISLPELFRYRPDQPGRFRWKALETRLASPSPLPLIRETLAWRRRRQSWAARHALAAHFKGLATKPGRMLCKAIRPGLLYVVRGEERDADRRQQRVTETTVH
jgi:hypothetical protein